MSDYGFELHGLDEFMEDIEKCVREYPEKTSKKVYNLSGEFVKDVNSKFPRRYENGKRPFPKNWKRERVKSAFGGYTVRVEVTNTSPHFHLVENGHEKKIPFSAYAVYIRKSNGKRVKRGVRVKKSSFQIESRGFLPGKHYCEKTRNEWKDKYPEEVNNFLDKMLKGNRI